MSNGDEIRMQATYGCKVVSQRAGLSINLEGGGGCVAGSSSGGEVATILAGIYGGALIGYVAGEVLVAILRGM